MKVASLTHLAELFKVMPQVVVGECFRDAGHIHLAVSAGVRLVRRVPVRELHVAPALIDIVPGNGSGLRVVSDKAANYEKSSPLQKHLLLGRHVREADEAEPSRYLEDA